MITFCARHIAANAADDQRWDDFLATVPGGNHTQTSLWGRVKATMGWRAVRVVAERHDRVAGGAQILYRRIPAVGAVGYVSRGPVLADDDSALGALLMDEVERTARTLGIRALAVQAPGTTDRWPAYLAARGYVEADTQVAPRATVILDVRPEPDEILAAMTSKTRYNIRLSGRRSVAVREGGVDDLDTYYQLLRATASRQRFTPYPKEYFLAMWRALTPGGHIRLALAEVDGVAVSAQLAIAFGDTVVNKLSVWSGEAGSRRPNEALQWSTIRWAHAGGYGFYDFEGVELAAARALVRGEPLPPSVAQSVTSFKLGFGGDVVLMPAVGVYVSNAGLRWGLTMLSPRVGRAGSVKAIINRARTRAGDRHAQEPKE